MPQKRGPEEDIRREHVKRRAIVESDAGSDSAESETDSLPTEQIPKFKSGKADEISDLESIPGGFDSDEEVTDFIDIAYKWQDTDFTFRYRVLTDCDGIREVQGSVKRDTTKIGSLKAQMVRRGRAYGTEFWVICDCFSKDLGEIAFELFDSCGIPKFAEARQQYGGTKGLFIYIDEVKMDRHWMAQDLHLKLIKYLLDGLKHWGMCIMIPYFGVTGWDLERMGFRDCGASFMAMYLVRSLEDVVTPGRPQGFKPIEIRKRKSGLPELLNWI